MQAPVRFLILVLTILVVAGVVMAPRRSEQVAMMLDRNEVGEIVAMLEPRLAAGEDEPELLATLGRAHAELGDWQRAAELMRRYTALRPLDGQAYAVLADIMKATGDTPGQMTMLERNVSLAPSAPRIAELAMLYRGQNRPADELDLLRRRESELPLVSPLRVRLAQLLEAAGDRDGAIAVLARAEAAASGAQTRPSPDARLLWAELLVRAGRSAEAVRLAGQWILEWREPYLGFRLLQIFAHGAPAAEAGSFGDAVMALNPEIRFYVVHQLEVAGAHPVAAHLLATWVAANKSASMDEIAGFLTACRELNEPGIVWQAFADVLAEGDASGLTQRFTEAIAAEFGIGALAPFWPMLPRAVLDADPLLEARLSFQEQQIDLTRSLLLRVNPVLLSGSDQQFWLALMQAVEPQSTVFARLRAFRAAGVLPPGLLPAYAKLAGSLGAETEFQAAMVALIRGAQADRQF